MNALNARLDKVLTASVTDLKAAGGRDARAPRHVFVLSNGCRALLAPSRTP